MGLAECCLASLIKTTLASWVWKLLIVYRFRFKYYLCIVVSVNPDVLLLVERIRKKVQRKRNSSTDYSVKYR